VIAIGGIRSGKTLVIARWMIDRGTWDTSQFHGLFANTWPQLQSAVLGEVLPWIELAGIEWVWNKRPPAEWIERWRKLGIKIPPRLPRYTNVLILSTGLHVYCGTMSNRSYRQIKGMKFGSAVIEEACAGATEEAIRYIFERVNCGLGPKRCAEEHHHVKILHANPPDEDGHWIYDWLARQNKRVAKAAGLPVSESEESYAHLLRGIGDTVYIISRTIDNVEHLPGDFIDDMAGAIDDETAARVLGGGMTRKKAGRAYNLFDQKNEWAIKYDRDRTLYLFFDFNGNPTVAGMAHPLVKGEVPSELWVDGSEQIGVFGEFFHVGGMDAHQLARSLVSGDKGSNGYAPQNWRGLKDHRGPVVVFGDAKGGAKQSMTGFTPWSIVHEVLRPECGGGYRIRVGTVNPLQQIRIRSVNGRFKNMRGERLLFVDPNCHELIHDLLTVQTNPDGTIKKPGGPRPGSEVWKRTHISDGLGYMVCELFPMAHDVAPGRNRPRIRIRGKYDRPRLR
jgi:hypothetical protein